MKTKSILLSAALGLACAMLQATLLFEEDFGTLADGTTVTTSNTDLTYVRVGSGGGSILFQNPSSFSGASAFISGPSSTSLNGIGVSGLDNFRFVDFEIDFRLANTDGSLVFGIGTGDRFTGSSTFSEAQGMFWLQINSGQLQRRESGAWQNVGDVLSENTNYNLRVVSNGSLGEVTYDSFTLSPGTMNIILDGSPVASNVSVTNSLTSNALRIYSVSGASVELDNISIAIPEPGTLILFGLTGLAVVLGLRRKQA